jgi:hypothetical protein
MRLRTRRRDFGVSPDRLRKSIPLQTKSPGLPGIESAGGPVKFVSADAADGEICHAKTGEIFLQLFRGGVPKTGKSGTTDLIVSTVKVRYVRLIGFHCRRMRLHHVRVECRKSFRRHAGDWKPRRDELTATKKNRWGHFKACTFEGSSR